MINVLIVDDSAAIRKILQRVLRQADVPVGGVFEAGDGIEALETRSGSERRNQREIRLRLSIGRLNGQRVLSRLGARGNGNVSK